MWFQKWRKQNKEFNEMPSKEDLGATSKIYKEEFWLDVGEGVCSHLILDERSEGEWMCSKCDLVIYGCKHPEGFTKINDTEYECLDCGLVNEEM